jgi:DNA-directed RNA polymerase
MDLRGKQSTVRAFILPEYHSSTRDLAYVILVSIVRSISKNVYVKATALMTQIVNAVHKSILLRRLNENNSNLDSYLDAKYSHRSKEYREKLKVKMIRNNSKLNINELDTFTLQLGATLLDIVIKSGCNIIEDKIINTKNKTIKHIVYTEECFRMVLQSRERLLTDYKKYPILVVPPKDWESFEDTGGYQLKDLYELPMIKCSGSSKKLLREYFGKKGLGVLNKVLNTIQQTPWRINKRVFDVMRYVFDNNIIDHKCQTNNPYLLGNLPYNGLLEAEDFVSPYNYDCEIWLDGKYKGLPKEKDKMLKYFRDIEEQNKLIIANRGKAIMTNLVLNNAEEYLDMDRIYFSYQFDFRGRIYPIQQHLQPQGDGKVKALLEFTEGCKLDTDEAVRWFMIHGANCYGFDKELYEDRIKKIQEKHTEILQVAQDPFKYRECWADADDPYLFLAWCFEYADYNANPNEFISHIPIALDATCSGIQIYSGLLLDKDGAKAVNVVGDTREDIYQRVADKANKYLEDGEYPKYVEFTTSDGVTHTEPTEALINSIRGKITRKLCKRNTMTQPYSVTKFGMYEQNKAELSDMENNNKKFWVGDAWLFAKVLTELNDRAITETVKGARVGQEYLKEVTKEVVGKGGYIFYNTPITDFPVLQKIHKTKVDRIQTPIGKLSIRKTIPEIHRQKMINGIAPNYIHSLDGTLLAYTVMKLYADGVSNFHLIHDSYGVPANQVEYLNRRVREAYVEIFSEEPLSKWLLQVCKDYPVGVNDVMLNTLDLEEVYNSSYIFS